MFQELTSAASVFGGDYVAFAQGAQGAEGDVLEITDRRGDEVERAREERRRSLFWFGHLNLRSWATRPCHREPARHSTRKGNLGTLRAGETIDRHTGSRRRAGAGDLDRRRGEDGHSGCAPDHARRTRLRQIDAGPPEDSRRAWA